MGALRRPPRKRGNQAGKRGLSKQQVCVLSAVDRSQNNYMKPVCLAALKYGVLKDNLSDRIASDSVLITDRQRSYPRFCKDLKLEHKVIHGFRKQRGAYHMNTINGVHSQLKRFMGRFNGVATKYLDNYLVFYQWTNKEVIEELGKTPTHSTYVELRESKMNLK